MTLSALDVLRRDIGMWRYKRDHELVGKEMML